MSNLLESKIVRRIIWVLGGLIVLCLVFGAGISVGYRRAGFASSFDKNYYHNFFGPGPGFGGGPAGFAGPMAFGAPGSAPIHGIAGTVIDVGTSTISVADGESNEQSVIISSSTVIRENNGNVALTDIGIGDHVAAIGAPTDSGQIDARFVRVFPAGSTTTPALQ